MRVTKHASRRLQQRGIPGTRLERHIQFADRVVPVGDGSICLTVSREGLADLAAEGVNRQELERLRRLAVVIAADEAVRTVMHLHARRGRRYRGSGVRGRPGSRRSNCPRPGQQRRRP